MLFKIGTFIKRTYGENGNFGIFEGDIVPNDYNTDTKSYSLAFFYNPKEYNTQTREYEATYQFATDDSICSEKVTKYSGGSLTWSELTASEKEEALDIMNKCGLYWDEDNYNLISINTGEVLYHIIKPNNEYNGQAVIPIDNEREKILKEAFESTLSKTATKTNYAYNGYQTSFFEQDGHYPYAEEYYD